MTRTDEQTTRHRVFGFFRAPETAAGFLVLVALVFIWTWSRVGGGEPEPSGPLRLDGRVVTAAGGFFVAIEADRPVYVALFHRRADGGESLVFPRLGPPRDLPWPLPGRTRHRLPASDEPFRATLGVGEAIVVVARRDRVPGSSTDFEEDSEESAMVIVEAPGS